LRQNPNQRLCEVDVLNSMTGFGKSETVIDGRKIRVEMKSVNNRFLDVNIRQPRFMLSYEDMVRQYLKKSLIRGRVDVFINYSSEREDSKTVTIDMALIGAYVKAAKQISEETGVENDLSVTQLMRMPDTVNAEDNTEDEEAMRELLMRALEEAVGELKKARAREGGQLKEDIMRRLSLLDEAAGRIKSKEHVVIDEYRKKLRERLKEVLENNTIDEQRIAQEVAIYADKANITEEVVRIRSHLKQFEKLSGEDGAQGRNMDFLVQELNREFNTIGSKSQDAEILGDVIFAKGEIEKIREQIQNIE